MMRYAKLFHSVNEIASSHAKELIQKHGPTIQEGWKRETKILDVGCGDGNVTKFLTSYFPRAQWSACDISLEMLQFAQKNYGDLDIKFFHLDIRKDVKDELKMKFDCVFSLFVLQRVRNHKVAFSNLYSLMKPNGRCLFSIISDNEMFDIDRLMAKNPKWSPYIRDVEQLISPYHGIKNPELSLKKVMLESGFRDISVATNKIHWPFNDAERYRNLIKCVDFCISEIPLELHEEYLDDYLELYADRHEKSPPYYYTCSVLEAIAHKVVFSNLYSLMKFKGRSLFSIISDNEMFDIDRIIAKNPKWSPYIRNVEELISPYHGVRNPEQSLKKVMLECGFRDVAVTTKKIHWPFNDAARYRNLIKCVDPCLSEIPLELHEEYLDDYLALYADRHEESPSYYYTCSVLEAIAHK